MFKKFSFWFTTVSVSICGMNYLGYDDKGLLLYYTSPLYWLGHNSWFATKILNPYNTPSFVVYLITILSYYYFGRIVDTLIRWFND